jgi:RHS repeat-associated protein
VKASRPGLGAGGETLSITRGGWLFFPPVNETLSYDLDGNLTEDARWTYGWDGDNRLIWMEEKPIAGTGPRPPQQRLEYDYDSQSRRIAKRVLRKTHEMGDWSLQQHRQFLYDGWNMIAEIDISISSGTARLHRSYAWGLDASGTLTGAGGVGGLLLTTHYGTAGNSNVTLAPLYDFNSNVLAYADVTTSTITHRIDYDPFGNELTLDTLLPTEAAEEAPRFRFSTKYTDSESGLVYYGFRSYSPEIGRWVNRDPIEERGGVNLYGMVGNDPVNAVDLLGLMVTATYDISRQKFTASSDTGDKMSCSKRDCSCGDNDEDHTDQANVGPLPKGTYKIYQRIKAGNPAMPGVGGNAWILDPVDNNPGNDVWDPGGRSEFRIHLWLVDPNAFQKGSNGCIVLSPDCHGKFDELVSKTTPGPKKKITSPDPNAPGGTMTFDEVAELGTLTVK